jgi:hypothetical protein
MHRWHTPAIARARTHERRVNSPRNTVVLQGDGDGDGAGAGDGGGDGDVDGAGDGDGANTAGKAWRCRS